MIKAISRKAVNKGNYESYARGTPGIAERNGVTIDTKSFYLSRGFFQIRFRFRLQLVQFRFELRLRFRAHPLN